MINPDDLIIQYFRYLISDFGFHVAKREFNPTKTGTAFVVFRSSGVGIEIATDRNEVSIRIGDGMDPTKSWFEFGTALKYYAPSIENAYEYPEYKPGDTWEDIVLPQLNRLAKMLREYCEPLLKGDLSGKEAIMKIAKEGEAKMIAQLNDRSKPNRKSH